MLIDSLSNRFRVQSNYNSNVLLKQSPVLHICSYSNAINDYATDSIVCSNRLYDLVYTVYYKAFCHILDGLSVHY